MTADPIYIGLFQNNLFATEQRYVTILAVIYRNATVKCIKISFKKIYKEKKEKETKDKS